MEIMEAELGLEQDYEIINGRKVVKKHVATIHCSNKLSLLERKISNALLFHAFKNLKYQLVHEIRLDELKRLIGTNTRNHKVLKDALKKLISTVLEWNLLGDSVPEIELEGWNASTILSSVSVYKGIIKYQYSELIKTLIIDPSIYGKINLAIQARFNSSYALALYENCSRYRGLPYTKNIDIGIFRKLMGVEDGKYEVFRDFNRRVLNQAISEINTCSDIRVSPEITRVGRTVKSIKFKLEERPIKQRIGMLGTTVLSPEKKEQPPEKDSFTDLKKRYGESKVENAIQYVKSKSSYKKGEIKNMAGYVASAINHQFEEKSTENPQKKVLTKAQQRTVDWIQHKIDYCRCITPSVVKQFCQLDSYEQHTTFTKFMNCANNPMTVSLNAKKFGETLDGLMLGLQEKNIHCVLFFEDGFTECLIQESSAIKASVISFDDFLKS